MHNQVHAGILRDKPLDRELLAHVREVLEPDFEVLNELDWIYPSDDE